MKSNFTVEQLKHTSLQVVDTAVKACVHCGMCSASCPTFILTGNELDSPRGRIYLVKDMLEKGRPVTALDVKHLDRCLNCLACTSVCPAHVDYKHLIDTANNHIHKNYTRPLLVSLLRTVLRKLISSPSKFRLFLYIAKFALNFKILLPNKLIPLFRMLPEKIFSMDECSKPGSYSCTTPPLKRVALFTGCAQQVLSPEINAATIRLLNRHGCEVIIAKDINCCGALDHHLGAQKKSRERAINNIKAWTLELENDGLDAIVINTSGCGVHVKDYGYLMAGDLKWAQPAKKISQIAVDITEFMTDLLVGQELNKSDQIDQSSVKLAYHSACSLIHGQKIVSEPKCLLQAAGFKVIDIPEQNICCGSAGVYNILQTDLAGQLAQRKVNNIKQLNPDLIVSGNIGCIQQLSNHQEVPVLHIVQLLDWATGGPAPLGLKN